MKKVGISILEYGGWVLAIMAGLNLFVLGTAFPLQVTGLLLLGAGMIYGAKKL